MNISKLYYELYKAEMKENKDTIINIGDRTYKADDLIVYVPCMYREKIEKIKFNDTEELSKCLMYMKCAEKAIESQDEFLFKRNEVAINWFIKNRVM